MVDEFCNSHFSFEEKRELFFPDHAVVCRTCHKPRIKRLIDLHDFSIRHQNLICMFGRPHGGAPGPALHGAHGPHINPLYVTRVEFNAFKALVNQNMQQLQNQINNMQGNMQKLQNQQNQLQGNMQQLQNQQNQSKGNLLQLKNQLQGNMQQLQNQLQGNMQQLQNQLQGQINQMGQNIANNTLGNINNNIARINQRLGIN